MKRTTFCAVLSVPAPGGGLGTHFTRRPLIDVDNLDEFNQPSTDCSLLEAFHQTPPILTHWIFHQLPPIDIDQVISSGSSTFIFASAVKGNDFLCSLSISVNQSSCVRNFFRRHIYFAYNRNKRIIFLILLGNSFLDKTKYIEPENCFATHWNVK